MITDGVRKLPKPQAISIGLPKVLAGDKWRCRNPVLNVVDAKGASRSFKISKKVAEALISTGIGYEG